MIKAQLDILELDYSPLRYLMGYSESSGRPPVLVGMLGWILVATGGVVNLYYMTVQAR
jgi:hypothetical protein